METKLSVGHYGDKCDCKSCRVIRRDALCTRCAGTRKDVSGNFCTDCNGWGSRLGQLMTLETRAAFVRANYSHLPGAEVNDDNYSDGVTGPNAFHRYG